MKSITEKMKPANIDEYISMYPKEIQEKLELVRKVIHDNAPTATEDIKYQMPTFVLKKNLIHFAAFKNHIGLYPTPDPIVEFADELKNYKTTKGAIQFPMDKPLPVNLIKRIVQYRVKQVTLK
jgi:uncharacterized protein YdhG (YjbR/CyaY superfamily)